MGPTAGGDFSCDLSMVNIPRQYVVGQPVILFVYLTNHTSREIRIQDSLGHYPLFSFDIVGPAGRLLELKTTWEEGIVEGLPEQPTLGPGNTYRVMIDVARWYDLSQPGRYSLRPKWQALIEPLTDVREAKSVTIAVVPPEQAEVVKLIHNATFTTASTGSELPAQCQLVEMGEAAVPALVEWLEIVESSGGPGWNGFADMVDVLSQIGSPRARQFLTAERAHDSILKDAEYRAILLKRIEIWQGPDRFARLIEALDEKGLGGLNRKWAIFKLGVLGDTRAIRPLARIARKDKEMDIRETAKDALAHLRDPRVPMRYVNHLYSQDFKLTAAERYRVGEPVKVCCRLTAGPYGSQKLVEFSKPKAQFLPWGFPNSDPTRNYPLSLVVDCRRDGTYDEVLPPGQVRMRDGRIASDRVESHGSYVDVAGLESTRTFTLKPGKSRLYEFADLRRVFHMTEPGEYRLCIHLHNRGLSEFLFIHIDPAASGSASAP